MVIEQADIESLKATIGSNVNRLRKGKGLSARKLALLADLEHHQILAIEKATVDSRISTLLKVSRALGVYVDDLFHDKVE